MANDKVVDAVETKIVSMLDALQQGAVTVGHVAVKYAPDVADAVLNIVRIDALGKLIPAIAFFIICLSVFIYIVKYIRKVYANKKEDYDFNDKIFIACMCSLPFVTVGIISSLVLLNIWSWVAVFEPKLALAKQIIDSVLNTHK